jgi:hypothetical protein
MILIVIVMATKCIHAGERNTTKEGEGEGKWR